MDIPQSPLDYVGRLVKLPDNVVAVIEHVNVSDPSQKNYIRVWVGDDYHRRGYEWYTWGEVDLYDLKEGDQLTWSLRTFRDAVLREDEARP